MCNTLVNCVECKKCLNFPNEENVKNEYCEYEVFDGGKGACLGNDDEVTICTQEFRVCSYYESFT